MENDPLFNPRSTCAVCPVPAPDLHAEPHRGSLQQLLRYNIGRFAAVYPADDCHNEPLSGIIECVTGRYVVLKDPVSSCRLVSDAWNAKHITFPCNET